MRLKLGDTEARGDSNPGVEKITPLAIFGNIFGSLGSYGPHFSFIKTLDYCGFKGVI